MARRKELNLKKSTPEVKRVYDDVQNLLKSEVTGYEIAQFTDVDINTIYQLRRGELLLENTRFITVAELHKFYKTINKTGGRNNDPGRN